MLLVSTDVITLPPVQLFGNAWETPIRDYLRELATAAAQRDDCFDVISTILS